MAGMAASTAVLAMKAEEGPTNGLHGPWTGCICQLCGSFRDPRDDLTAKWKDGQYG